MYECNRVAVYLHHVGLARLVRVSETCDRLFERQLRTGTSRFGRVEFVVFMTYTFLPTTYFA